MEAYIRAAGSGPTVICLHSNASSSGQWRLLMELLAPDFRVLAPDLLGAGRSPAWPGRADEGLQDELALLAPLLARTAERFHLVGHSYGAAVAAKLALAMPHRVASLLLFEPTLFALLEHESPGRSAATGITDAAGAAADAAARGDLDAAGQGFIDYWMGTGTWAAMPEARREAIAAAMHPIGTWSRALMTDPVTAAEIATLPMPVALMGGETTTDAAKGVLRVLRQALPAAESTVMAGIGHMGPVTHADAVNARIRSWLMAQR